MATTGTVSEREEKYRLIFENANEAIFVAQDGVIKFPNPRCERMLGYPAEELARRQFLEQIHPEDRAMVVDRYRRRLVGEELADTYEFRILPRGGGEIWGQLKTVKITWEGRPATLNFIREITGEKERARLEEQNRKLREVKLQLERMNQDLAVKNAELERFSETVSHDLKVPLVTVRSYLGLLKDDLEQGDAARVDADVASIEAATGRMDRLIDDLLALSTAGRVVDAARPVALSELAREAVDLAAGKIAERGVAVTVAPDLPVVLGDRRRLLAVFQNLIDNAVKYMGDEPRPRIEIGSRREDGETVVFVRDSGIGIEDADRDAVFDLFQQLDSDSEGVGLGLPLVQRIVEAHRGRVWFESEGRGRGSTFCLILPLAR